MLDLLADALLRSTVNCRECAHSTADRCRRCADVLADVGAVMAAVGAVESAATEAEALAAYTSCVLELPRPGTGEVRYEQSRRRGLRKVRREHYLA